MNSQTTEVTDLDIAVTDMAEADLDAQPFGVIRLDPNGRILSYNTFEEQLARKSRAEVIGKSFFFEVAPCTHVRAFYGRFVDGVARRDLRVRFGFTFTFEHGPRDVEVSMLYRHADDTVWVIVRG